MAKEIANGSLTTDKTDPILCNLCEVLKVNDFICGPKKGKNKIPEEEYEIEGCYRGCVFPCGSVVIDGTLFMYYGAADKYVALATTHLEEFLDLLHILDE